MSVRCREVDVAVVGAGPAGLAAAAAAAEAGRRVLVIDQSPRAGGQIWRHRDEGSLGRVPRALLARVASAGVTVLTGTTVVDAVSPRQLLVEGVDGVEVIDTTALVLATGARERFLPFPGWTLPGVAGVGGLQALLKGGTSFRGKRVVLAGTGPLLVAVAAALADAGARLVLVAEQAPWRRVTGFALHAFTNAGRLRDALRYRWAFARTPYVTDAWVTAADGDTRLRDVEVRTSRGTRTVDCDWLGCAAGLVPTIELAQLLGCTVERDRVRVDSMQSTSVTGVWAAGECTGVKGDAAALAEGEIAGRAAAGDTPGATSAALVRARDDGRLLGARIDAAFSLRAELLNLAAPDTIICRCEDVRRDAIDPAWTPRQAKLWTRVGMGACQGAVCGPACSALFGWAANTVRAPLGAPSCGAWQAALTPPALPGPPSPVRQAPEVDPHQGPAD
ncbi:MAG: FAD-dependent oxidoreductase [Gemmatimonadales bacterium]|nr:FAD-dependent oxidoreductase [Gemmatimonadales bacterium]